MTKQKVIAIIGAIILVVVLIIVYFVLIVPKQAGEPEFMETVDIPPMPETLAEAVKILNTSQILVAFLNKYFTVEERPGLVAYVPEEFFEKQGGTDYDFAVFAAYILRQNRFEAGIIRFNYLANEKEGTHTVTVFRDVDLPKYLTVTDRRVEIFHHGWSFADLIKAEEQRLNVNIYEYAYFPANTTDLTEPIPGYPWQEVK